MYSDWRRYTVDGTLSVGAGIAGKVGAIISERAIMSKHKMVDGRLLQMNKSYGQLKKKQIPGKAEEGSPFRGWHLEHAGAE